MKEYVHLLADDPEWAQRARDFSAKVRDVNELLAELEPRAPRRRMDAKVAYHDACHLGHAQGVREQPRALLRTIPDSRWSTCRKRIYAADRPGSTTWCNPNPPPSSASARRTTSATSPPTCW